MSLSNYDVVYDIFVKKPFENFKKNRGGAYFLKKGYILCPNNWADPMVWFGSHLCFCCDVDDYLYNNVLEDYGEKEAEKFYDDDATFEKYCKEYGGRIKGIHPRNRETNVPSDRMEKNHEIKNCSLKI